MTNDSAAAGRARQARGRRRPPADAPAPGKGTALAVGFPLLASAVTFGWVAHSGLRLGLGWLPLVGLLVAATCAERIEIQLGPRSWYSPSSAVLVLVGLLGGPVAGALAGVATALPGARKPIRRRSTEAGVAALQGSVAGLVGLVHWETSTGAVAVAALAMACNLVVNSTARALVIRTRRLTPGLLVWFRGVRVDAADSVIAPPVLAALMLVAPASEILAAAVVGSILTALTFAHRLSRSTIAKLETEQINARRDPLTGAPNRRAFEELLVVEHSRVLRGGQPSGLFVVDIDRFKSINDRFGHSVGDQVLIACFERLVHGLRTADVVARWGGEEITVLAPGIATHQALQQFGERIRALVGDLPLATQKTALSVTVSVGGTLFDGSQSATAALRQADQAMYEAKRRRDMVVVMMPPNRTLRLEAI
ncbi:MAG: GGDEF domain-containing protein [Gaiellales bacterium]